MMGFVVTSPQGSYLNSCRVVMRFVPYISGLWCSLHDRGRSQIWCQNRQFADQFPLAGTTQAGMIHHPDLGNDFTDQSPVTEKPYHRTLRDDNSNSLVTALMLAASM